MKQGASSAANRWGTKGGRSAQELSAAAAGGDGGMATQESAAKARIHILESAEDQHAWHPTLFQAEPVDFIALQKYRPPGATSAPATVSEFQEPQMDIYDYMAHTDSDRAPESARPPSAALLVARRWAPSRVASFGNARICGATHVMPQGGGAYTFVSVHMPSQWHDADGVEFQTVLGELSSFLVAVEQMAPGGTIAVAGDFNAGLRHEVDDQRYADLVDWSRERRLCVHAPSAWTHEWHPPGSDAISRRVVDGALLSSKFGCRASQSLGSITYVAITGRSGSRCPGSRHSPCISNPASGLLGVGRRDPRRNKPKSPKTFCRRRERAACCARRLAGNGRS